MHICVIDALSAHTLFECMLVKSLYRPPYDCLHVAISKALECLLLPFNDNIVHYINSTFKTTVLVYK